MFRDVPEPGDEFRVKIYETAAQVEGDVVSSVFAGVAVSPATLNFLQRRAGRVVRFSRTGPGVRGDAWYCAPTDPTDSLGMSVYDPGWLEPVVQTSTDFIPPCICESLLSGCRCGAMEAEMASRGLVRDQFSGLWVREH